MPNKLNTWVHVGDKRYGPDDDVPQDVADRISNPDVWAEGGPEGAAADPAVISRRGAQEIVGEPVRPPTSGAGSGRDAWAAYAVARGVEVSEGMSRDDIVAAVDGAEKR